MGLLNNGTYAVIFHETPCHVERSETSHCNHSVISAEHVEMLPFGQHDSVFRQKHGAVIVQPRKSSE
jgi:hypothetical protein